MFTENEKTVEENRFSGLFVEENFLLFSVVNGDQSRLGICVHRELKTLHKNNLNFLLILMEMSKTTFVEIRFCCLSREPLAVGSP